MNSRYLLQCSLDWPVISLRNCLVYENNNELRKNVFDYICLWSKQLFSHIQISLNVEPQTPHWPLEIRVWDLTLLACEMANISLSKKLLACEMANISLSKIHWIIAFFHSLQEHFVTDKATAKIQTCVVFASPPLTLPFQSVSPP